MDVYSVMKANQPDQVPGSNGAVVGAMAAPLERPVIATDAASSQRNCGCTPRNVRMEVASAAVRAEEAKTVDELKEAISNMTIQEKEEALLTMAQRIPLDIAPYIKNASTTFCQDRVDNSDIPYFCHCSQCVPMDVERERICCKMHPCVTTTPTFVELCMKPSVLEVCGIENYGYTFGRQKKDYSNRKMRSVAYRFFALWQWGSLGPGKRRVLPSCAVARIRWCFPDPEQSYTGVLSGDD